MRGKPRGDALEIGAALRFDPADGDALAVGVRAGARPRAGGASCPRRERWRRRRRAARGRRVRAEAPPPARCGPSAAAFARCARRPRRSSPKIARRVALLCYGLLVAAWIVDLLTPQLFIAAILLNGPIALSSLALQSRLTTNWSIAAEIANAVAGYVNGVQAGHHWDGVAIGDRLLLGRVVRAGRLLERQDAGVRARSRRVGRAHAPGRNRESAARSDGTRARNAQRRARAARDHCASRSSCSARRRRC